MKKYILMMALGIAPVQAIAEDVAPTQMFDAFISVEAGLNYQNSDSDQDQTFNESGVAPSYALRGGLSGPLSTRLGGQFDIVHKWDSSEWGAFNYKASASQMVGHLYYLPSANAKLGVIAQATLRGDDAGSESENIYVFGLEGQYFLSNSTFSLKGGYGFVDPTYDIFHDLDATSKDSMWAFSAEYLRFYGPNMTGSLKVDYSNQKYLREYEDLILGYKSKSITATLGFEKRMTSMPVSLLGNLAYTHQSVDYDIFYYGQLGSKTDQVRALVGFKVNFGTHTLLERNRAGASLSPFELPKLQGSNYDY